MFWKASVLEKTEGNKDFPFIEKLKVITGKPSVLCYKKSKQKENRTEGNKGTHFFRIAKYFLTYWGMLKLNNYGVRSYSLYNLVSCLPVLQQCHLNFLLVSSKFSWLLFWYVCSLVYAQWFNLAWIGVW